MRFLRSHVILYGLFLIVNIGLLWLFFASCIFKLFGFAVFVLIYFVIFNVIFLHPKAYPIRYLLPGVTTFVALLIFPLVYTIYVSFTNLGTGHYLSRQDVQTLLLSETIQPEDGLSFFYEVGYRSDRPSNPYALILFQSSHDRIVYTAILPKLDSIDSKTPIQLKEIKLSPLFDTPQDWLRHKQYEPVSKRWKIKNRQYLKKVKLFFPKSMNMPKGIVLSLVHIHRFAQQTPKYRLIDSEKLKDQITGIIYTHNARSGFYENKKGDRLLPGFTTFIGIRNFGKLFTDPRIIGPFAKVFIWTNLWALFTVFLTFSLGILLSLFLQNQNLSGRAFYRIMLIIPYAIPFFISVLIWKGLLNTDFGIVNNVVHNVFGIRVPWLDLPLLAKMSCLLVNLWLGYPYMMLISTGILQSIPAQIYEVANLDGIGKIRQFFSLTLPMVMSAIAPLLVGSFAFNFNNFVGIYLLTGGGPPMIGAQTPAGETDILASYTYRLAFEGGAGNDFGFAAAIAILIFFIIGGLSLINFKIFGFMKEETT